MSHFLRHAHFFDQPVWLTKQEIKNPYEVLDRFQADFSLSELRQHLYEMIDASLTTDNSHFDDPDQRGVILLLQVRLEMLLEAVFLIAKQREQDNLVRT